jgi:glycosyltransferase involved in cell wall biosynthesis
MKEKKNIWFINQYAGSPVHGMEYRHFYLGQELIRAGHDVVIISGSFSHLHKQRPETHGLCTQESIDGITYCWIQTTDYAKSVSFGRLKNMYWFKKNLKKLSLTDLPQPHAVVVSSPSMFPVIFAKKICRKFKAKLIFEIRDIWPLTLREIGNLSFFHPVVMYMKYFERYGYRNADFIVSLLPDASGYYEKNGMKKEKFRYIPNGIDPNLWNHDPDTNIDFNIPSKKFIVGYAGTVGVTNALHVFIQAAQLLSERDDIHFVIAGNGGEKEALKSMAETLHNLTFVDAVQKSSVPSLLEQFDACYIGLKNEPLFRFGVSPNKLFDYMMAAKPIIYAIGSSNKPVDDAECGITIPPGSPEAIAEAVINIYKMTKDERKTMGQNGREYVLKNHAYNTLAQKYQVLI